MVKLKMKCVIEEEITLKPGIVFKHEEGEEYMLASVGGKTYCLISLRDGNRWDEIGTLEEVGRQLRHNGEFVFTGKHIQEYISMNEVE